jgi:hypothetical protein
MDIYRKIGIGIVMIIPSFVGSGVLWNIFPDWIPVLLWILMMVFLYAGILTGNQSKV